MQLPHRLLAALVCATAATPALAAPTPFFGTQQNQDVTGEPPFRCAPAITVNIRANRVYAFGSSNLGDFSVNQSHCIVPPLPSPFFDGVFEWSFENGASLLGTYSGLLSESGTPGVFALAGDYLITGGTGRFGRATGAFTTEGTLSFPSGLPTAFQRFDGFVDVPEPAVAALFGLGALAVGRARRQ